MKSALATMNAGLCAGSVLMSTVCYHGQSYDWQQLQYHKVATPATAHMWCCSTASSMRHTVTHLADSKAFPAI